MSAVVAAWGFDDRVGPDKGFQNQQSSDPFSEGLDHRAAKIVSRPQGSRAHCCAGCPGADQAATPSSRPFPASSASMTRVTPSAARCTAEISYVSVADGEMAG